MFISLSADLQVKQRVAINTEAGWFIGTVKLTKTKYATVLCDDGDTLEVVKVISKEVMVLPVGTPKHKAALTKKALKELLADTSIVSTPRVKTRTVSVPDPEPEVKPTLIKPKPPARREIGVLAAPTSNTQHEPKVEADVSHARSPVEALGIIYEKQIRSSSNQATMRRFMLDLWTALNKEKFDGRLRPVKKLMVIPSNRNGLRAFWHPSYRLIVFGDLVFKAAWAKFHEVFLHEMCHQAVTDLDHGGKAVVQEEGGHGPAWQAWMHHVGLEAKRYDDSTFSEYMSDAEKELFDKNAESTMSVQALTIIRKQNHYEEIHRLKLHKVKDGTVGAFVTFSDGTTEEPHDSVVNKVTKDSRGVTLYQCWIYTAESKDVLFTVSEDDDKTPLFFMKEPRLKYRAYGRKLAEAVRRQARKEGR